MSPSPNINVIRQRAYHYLNDATASAAGMRLEDLQQFIAYRYWPDEEQLRPLSRYMRLDQYHD